MEKEMEEKIKKQLVYYERKLYCYHNSEKPCDDCMRNITGNVSELTGNVSSGLRGNVSGIEGDAKEIIRLLKPH